MNPLVILGLVALFIAAALFCAADRRRQIRAAQSAIFWREVRKATAGANRVEKSHLIKRHGKALADARIAKDEKLEAELQAKFLADLRALDGGL